MLLRRIVQHTSPTLLFPQCRVGLRPGGRRGTGTTRRPDGHPRKQSTAAVAATTTPANTSQRSGEGKENPNEGILEMLRLEVQEEERKLQPNVFRIGAFAKAIETISRIEETIKSGDDYVLEVQGIGIGIKNRINHYFVQQDLEVAYNEEQKEDALRRAAVIDLQSVPGIGRVKAKALADAGCRSMRALLESEQYHSILTRQQIICLKYIDHLDQTSTREEAEGILDDVRKCLPSQYEAVLVGDYRRGISEISNLDIMLLHRDFVHVPMPTQAPTFPTLASHTPSEPSPPSFEPFWDSLESSPSPSSSSSSSSSTSTSHIPDSPSPAPPKPKSKSLLRKRERASGLTKTARNASPLHNEVIPCLRKADVMCETIGETVHTWTGVVRVPPSPEDTLEAGAGRQVSKVASSLQTPAGVKYRRVAFHLIPQKSRYAALLALTGDDDLNRYLRKKAERQGMLLDEYGLWRWNTSGGSSVEGSESPSTSSSPTQASGSPEPAATSDVEGSPGGFWSLVQTSSEMDVFKEIGMRYIPPEKRNWGFVNGTAKLRPTKKRFSTSFVGS